MSQINLILPQLKYATRDISEDHKINASYLFYYESIDLSYDIIFYNENINQTFNFCKSVITLKNFCLHLSTF